MHSPLAPQNLAGFMALPPKSDIESTLVCRLKAC